MPSFARSVPFLASTVDTTNEVLGSLGLPSLFNLMILAGIVLFVIWAIGNLGRSR